METIPDGWTNASDFPDSDREVEVMYEDGSTTVGYADTVSGDEDKPKVWWLHPFRQQVPGVIAAWRETSPEGKPL